ncbi:hypothetical protein M422DRAFT_253160 [Sphaerobolus stellatus SS14]|uniref:NACHT domain-containing protein n=1 Tax=Sphaerobolus stellatus (strain SS14) TaxID=990650 RepID=A0A0C9UKG6_SPHS4|nr:hypothetical protein M422DRAFT_253160 [Sphaerobolus stellatus SS14]
MSSWNWSMIPSSAELERFRAGGGEFLWLHGAPGAGKIILSGSIIAALSDHVEAKSENGLAYFFVSYTDKAKQNTFNMLSSDCCTAGSAYLKHSTRKIITRLAQCLRQIYIVIDGLDEIEVVERDGLMEALNDITANSRLSNINSIVTNRREPYLVDRFRNLLLEEIYLTTSKVDEDIKLYVTEIVDTAPELSKWSVELKAEIVQTLTDMAKGMLCWVEYQMESLNKCRQLYDVKEVLASLPKTLDGTCKGILLGAEEEDRVYVARLLAWVTFTSTPLCLTILAEIIVFDRILPN